MEEQQTILVTGHRGMAGSTIVGALGTNPKAKILTRSHFELDLTNQQAVREFFASEKIDEVYLAAAKVSGQQRVSDGLHPPEPGGPGELGSHPHLRGSKVAGSPQQLYRPARGFATTGLTATSSMAGWVESGSSTLRLFRFAAGNVVSSAVYLTASYSVCG